MALDQLNQMARLVERNWCAAWASLGRVNAHPPTLVDNTHTALRVYTPGAPETLLNLVMRYADPAPVTRERIEAVIAPYRAAHLPFQWWLTRGTEPDGLREALAELGMETWGGATMMLLALDGWRPRYPPAPTDVRMSQASADGDYLSALGVICDVFYIPREPMRRWTTLNPAFDLWLAWRQERPVAALATLRDGDTVGVYHVATVPWARRRGIAGNLLLRALTAAQGARWATLTATPDARALYESLGFRAYGLLEQWMPGARLARELTGAGLYESFESYWE